jgi:hypothetical protein
MWVLCMPPHAATCTNLPLARLCAQRRRLIVSLVQVIPQHRHATTAASRTHARIPTTEVRTHWRML